MPQEFLASFAVDIDEGGVTRLQSILSQNRDLAAGLAAAFDAAWASLRDALPDTGFPGAAVEGGEFLSSAASLVYPAVQPSLSNSTQAPVNIHVEAAAADPEAVGRSIYDTAERYLLRTLTGVM